MYTARQRNRHLMTIAVLIVVTYVFSAFINQGSVNMAGEYVDKQTVNAAVLKTLLIAVPILSFILGALFAFIPYKKLSYKKKYLRASLLTIIVINSLMLLNVVVRFGMALVA